MKWGINLGLGFLAYQVLRLAGVPIEAFLSLLIVTVIGWPIGWFIGTLIGDEVDVDTRQFKAIGWANLFAWIIPIAGIAVAKLTSSIGKESVKNNLFYDAMAVAGYALVTISLPIFVHMALSETQMQEQHNAGAMPTFSEHIASNERSFARCPYAAIENWTAAEMELHCSHEPSDEEMRAFEEEQRRRGSKG